MGCAMVAEEAAVNALRLGLDRVSVMVYNMDIITELRTLSDGCFLSIKNSIVGKRPRWQDHPSLSFAAPGGQTATVGFCALWRGEKHESAPNTDSR